MTCRHGYFYAACHEHHSACQQGRFLRRVGLAAAAECSRTLYESCTSLPYELTGSKTGAATVITEGLDRHCLARGRVVRMWLDSAVNVCAVTAMRQARMLSRAALAAKIPETSGGCDGWELPVGGACRYATLTRRCTRCTNAVELTDSCLLAGASRSWHAYGSGAPPKPGMTAA